MSSDKLKETGLVYKVKQKVYSLQMDDKEKAKLEMLKESERNAAAAVDAATVVTVTGVNDEAAEVNTKYPKIVFLIILNEFCERFSYYGLRTVLFIYLTTFIKLGQDSATAIYHAFTVLCYFTPLLGAILADGYIGLYRTILYVSSLYCVGEIILTLTSLEPLGAPNVIGPLIALVIIGFGTGGIKPCVSAFGGNQFGPGQKKYLSTFFSIFYLSINIGSTIGTILTPILRSDVKCYGHDCFSLAFGIPAGVMFFSIVVFAIGTRYYNRDDEKCKNGQNIIASTFKCIFYALKNRISQGKRGGDTKEKTHWLDYADGKFSKKLIGEVKSLTRVLFVFLPLPIFWALYDQQGSRWTLQAQQLNGRVGASFIIKPDQFQAVNPILIIFLVPLFDFVIYPLFAKINLLKRQLQRMCVGLVLAIGGFLLAALLESRMQASYHALNPIDQIKIVNLSPCRMSFAFNDVNFMQLDEAQTSRVPEYLMKEIFQHGRNESLFNLDLACQTGSLSANLKVNNKNLPKAVILYLDESTDNLNSYEYAYDPHNKQIGSSQIRFQALDMIDLNELAVTLAGSVEVISFNDTKYKTIDYGSYKLNVKSRLTGETLLERSFFLDTTATYTIFFYANPSNVTKLESLFLTDVHANGLHIAWQLIQIAVMTIGEIMFSINGISFAYSQAPHSMKSVLQAMWCMTVAFGNLIVVIIAEAKIFENQVYEYLLYVGLLACATIVFGVLSFMYKYVDEHELNQAAADAEPIENESSDNSTTNQSSKGTSAKSSFDSDIQLIRMGALDPN